MRTTQTNATEEVLDYLETLPLFSKNICTKLREVILNAVPDIIEDWKYGPVYNWLGAVCGYTCFQKHVRLTFFNGAIMSDYKHFFEHHADGHFNRSIRYTHVNELSERMLIKYIKESAYLNELGFKHKIESNAVVIPDSLRNVVLMQKSTHKF